MAGFRLIITEKPSVARDIARVLGLSGRENGVIGAGKVRISWCLGHLLELADPVVYDPAWRAWRLESLPMLPPSFRLSPRKDSREQWQILRGLMTAPGLEEVVNACDAGREGELIFAYAYQASGCKAGVRRLWISSMTDQAIHEGFKRLRKGEEMAPLEAAARCRSEADWLVGLNGTRAMTLRLRKGPESRLLSLGRVQTPTLALLVEREQEIEEFVPRDFWQVRVRFSNEKGSWETLWTRQEPGGKRVDRVFEKELATAVLERIGGKTGLVTHAEGRKTREKPPLLYDLTSLQKEANGRFGFSAQKTLDIAQSLYERRKVITYPRTDSRHIGADLVPSLPEKIQALGFGPYADAASGVLARWPVELTSRVVDDGEVSDHHAIIPTGVDPRTAGLDGEEKRLFDLVARRFLAVFHPDAVFSVMQVDTKIEEDLFSARGRSQLEPGWRAIDPPKTRRKEAEVVLPPLSEGDQAEQEESRLHEGQTKPPKRYTEAALLGAMERAGESLEDSELKRVMKRNGLGTPATRAAIIETLLRREYVRREKTSLVPTEEGRALIKVLPVPALRSPKMTGQWEARLVAIAEGRELREAFMEDIRRFTTELVETLRGAEIPTAEAAALARPPAADGEPLGMCPLCQGEVRAAARGWSCNGCGLFIPRSIARREISPRMAKALVEHRMTAPVKGFKSREGKTFRAALRIEDDGKISFHFPPSEALGDCPACGTPVRHRGKVYSCEKGRECPFVVFAQMQGKQIPEEAVRETLAEGRSGVMEGFETRDGRVFAGRLEWNGQRVVIAEIDPRQLEGPAGKCPLCGDAVAFSRGKWRCQKGDFELPAKVARRQMRREEISALLAEGRTPRLHGFRRGSGVVFKAALVLDLEREGRVRFDYAKPKDEPEPSLDPGAPPPALGRRVTCPACVGRADPDPGYIIAGRAAWGCSKWKQGCALRVPFEIEGQHLTDEDARRLFGKSRHTRYLRGLHGSRGNLPVSRVALDPAADPCWRLEAKA